MSFVSLPDLQELTGRKQGRKICEWLANNHWPFEVDADGLPRVDRRYYDRRMMGEAANEEQMVNIDGVKALAS